MIYRFGLYELNARRFLLSKNNEPLTIEPKVLELLICLLRHRGELVSKADLIGKVWHDTHVSDWALTRAIHEIRRVLDEDNEEQSCIKTVYGRGYQFIADVEIVDDGDLTNAAPIPPTQLDTDHNRGAALSPPYRWLLLLLGLTLSIPALWYYVERQTSVIANSAPGSVIVLPFTLRDANNDNHFIADGMTDEVIAKLAQVPGLKIISRTSSMHYKNSAKRATEIAAEVRVNHLVETDMIIDASQISAVVKLIAADSDQLLWTKTYQQKREHLQLLPNLIAGDVKKAVLNTLESTRQASVSSTTNAEVYYLYLRGRQLWNERAGRTIRQALTVFEQAIALDPHYAPAWAGLADVYVQSANYNAISPSIALPKARSSITKALQLNPDLVEAWAALGQLDVNQYFDWTTAERHYQRAISLAPGYATPRQWYAELLSMRGRHDEALAMIASAAELDPYSPLITAVWGLCLNAAGDYSTAIPKLQRAIELDSNFTWVYRELALAYIQLNDNKSALITLRRQMVVEAVADEFLAEFDRVTTSGGLPAFWRWYVEELHRRAQRGLVAPTEFAEAYTGIGDFDTAMIWLERAAKQKGEYLPHRLSRSSQFHKLVHLQRYRQLLAELGLSHLTLVHEQKSAAKL